MIDPRAHRRHFDELSADEKVEAIIKLASSMSDYGVSHATGFAVEEIRRILATRECEGCE